MFVQISMRVSFIGREIIDRRLLGEPWVHGDYYVDIYTKAQSILTLGNACYVMINKYDHLAFKIFPPLKPEI